MGKAGKKISCYVARFGDIETGKNFRSLGPSHRIKIAIPDQGKGPAYFNGPGGESSVHLHAGSQNNSLAALNKNRADIPGGNFKAPSGKHKLRILNFNRAGVILRAGAEGKAVKICPGSVQDDERSGSSPRRGESAVYREQTAAPEIKRKAVIGLKSEIAVADCH